MTPTQLQDMDDIALREAAERFCRPGVAIRVEPSTTLDLSALVSELVERFRPYAKAPDAFAFPTHEEEPAL